MEYRRQVTIRRDGDDFVVAFEPDGFIIYRNSDADALRKVCRLLRWEIVSDTTLSADELAWSLVPAESDPAESDPAESDPAESDPAESDPAESNLIESDPVDTDAD
jgi:hypothetical protein